MFIVIVNCVILCPGYLQIHNIIVIVLSVTVVMVAVLAFILYR